MSMKFSPEHVAASCEDFPGKCCPDCHASENELYDIQVVSLGRGDGASALVCCFKEREIEKLKMKKSLGEKLRRGGRYKLTDAQVREARTMCANGVPLHEIAEKFHITTQWASKLRDGVRDVETQLS